MALKIMNWNIEQFGDTRSKNPDRLAWAAKMIADYDPDICVVVEMKTLNPATCIAIADRLVNKIYLIKKIRYRYVLSYHNKLEMYCFLYKAASVNPIVLPAGDNIIYNYKNNPQLTTPTYREVNDVDSTLNLQGQIVNHFPLFRSPGMTIQRPHVMSFFRDKTGMAARYVGIVAVHCDVHEAYQITNDLENTPFLHNRQIAINYTDITNVQVTQNFQNLIVTGDFNTNFLDPDDRDAYNAFSGNNYTIGIQQPTHLSEYDKGNQGAGINQLLGAAYDNFIVTPAPGIPQFGVVNTLDTLYSNRMGTRTFFENSKLKKGIYQHSYDSIRNFCVEIISKWKKPYIKVADKKTMIDEIEAIDYWKIWNATQFENALPQTQQILGVNYNRFGQRARKQVESHIYFIEDRMGPIVYDAREIAPNDTLYFARAWISDHLPTLTIF